MKKNIKLSVCMISFICAAVLITPVSAVGFNRLSVTSETTKPQQTMQSQYWALIFAVGTFEGNPDQDRPSMLEACDALYDTLLDSPQYWSASNIHVQKGGQCYLQNLIKELLWLRKNSRSEDYVFIYLTTHGYFLTKSNGAAWDLPPKDEPDGTDEFLYMYNGFSTSYGIIWDTAEVQRSLRVLDGGIVVFDAVQGVEPQSETVWRQANRYGVPRICFVNKMDRPGASYERTIESIQKRLGASPIAMQVPVGSEASFGGVVDLMTECVIIWTDDIGKDPAVVDIPPDLKALVAERRAYMVEQIAESDDDLTMKYLEGEEITLPELKSALRRAVISGRLTPVFCGSSLRNKGVQPFLDAVIDYLPSPFDIPPVKGIHPHTSKELERPTRDDVPLSALVFKIVSDPYVGRLAYFRVYSGKITQDGQHVSDVVGATGYHGNCGGRAAGAHHGSTGAVRGYRPEQTHFQDGVQPCLGTEPQDDRQDDPAIPEVIDGMSRALGPRHDAKVQSS